MNRAMTHFYPKKNEAHDGILRKCKTSNPSEERAALIIFYTRISIITHSDMNHPELSFARAKARELIRSRKIL